MKERIEYLDVAKGIGILLVVFGHIYDNDIIRMLIYAFHMPLFIIISGILMSENSYKKSPVLFIKNKFKSLMLPYIITEIIVLPLFYCKYECSVSDIRWVITDSLFLYYTRGAATWFLLNLFIAEIIYYIILKFKNKYIVTILCIVLYFVSFIPYQENHLVVILLRSFNFVFYLMLGNLIFSKIKKWNIRFLGLIPVFGVSAIYNGMVTMVDSIYNNAFLFTISAIAGTIVVFSISEVISQKCYILKVIYTYWGCNSLIVLCTHLILMRYGIDIVLGKGPLYENIFVSLCIFGIVVVSEWIIIKGFHQIRFKNRKLLSN